MSLNDRDLTNANLSQADVRHVAFSRAILNRADLSGAWAKNADFGYAQLKGAALGWAHLEDALLKSTQLQGASLEYAQLQGATLDSAQLQGAWLLGTQLQGASLAHAELQGASLDYVGLQGAVLDSANLQGAWFFRVQVQGASLMNVCAWRADARKAIWKDTRVVAPMTSAQKESPTIALESPDEDHDCSWTDASFRKFKKLIADKVPEGALQRDAMKGIEQKLDPNKALDQEEEMATAWSHQERSSPSQEIYEKSLAEQWRETGCAAEGAPSVLQSLLVRLDESYPDFMSGFVTGFIGASPADPVHYVGPFGEESAEKRKLAGAFLDETHCAGAHGLSEADKVKLKKIAAPAALQAPKP